MALYLLHSTVPLHRARARAVRHYLGYCRDGAVTRRVKLHRSGKSQAAIVRAFLARGAHLVLARVWAGATPRDEQRMKAAGHYEDICPICSPDRVEPGDVGQWREHLPQRSSKKR